MLIKEMKGATQASGSKRPSVRGSAKHTLVGTLQQEIESGERIDEIERMTAERDPAYWNSEAMQAEYRDLVSTGRPKRRKQSAVASAQNRWSPAYG